VAIRIYLMPTVVGTRAVRDVRMPKYIALFVGRCTCIHYGPELVCLLVAEVTPAEHTAITANADVSAFPVDLDGLVTNAARLVITNALEALNVPAQWVANGMTFRLVLRRLAGIFQLLQGVNGRGLRFLQASLSSPISSLPANVRTAMQDAATTLQLDATGITGATTLRAALTTIGAQFDARPVLACRVSL
jgi:hypothetical protein